MTDYRRSFKKKEDNINDMIQKVLDDTAKDAPNHEKPE